jgi:archaellum component FlaC
MEKINNSPDELKGELKKLKEEREEVVEEKVEFEPGTIHILNVCLTNIEENIEKIKEKLAGSTESSMA